MSNPDHNETEDDNRVTEDDNRDDRLPSSLSLVRNQRDYNANKTIHQDVSFDKELSKSMNKTNAKRLFIDTYGESNSYLIYDFEKCKGNRLKEDVILLVLLKMGVSSYLFRNLFNVGLSRLERINGKTNRYNEVVSDNCRQDIDKFLKRAPLYRHVPCSHQEFVLFVHPIHNFHDACEKFQAVTGKSINVNTEKSTEVWWEKTSFMCRRPKYFPICGECENQETFVSKTVYLILLIHLVYSIRFNRYRS
jgi:hypothetical protein